MIQGDAVESFPQRNLKQNCFYWADLKQKLQVLLQDVRILQYNKFGTNMKT